MRSRQKIWLMVCLLGLAGAGVFVGLVVREGFGDILESMRRAGWWMGVVVAMHMVPLFFDALAWRALFPLEKRPGVLTLWWMRWFGEAVGTLLPATQVGGDVVRARLGATTGVALSVSAATVVVDITVSIFAQTLFTLTGLGLLAWVTGKSTYVGPAIAGGLVAVMVVGAFYLVQHFGVLGLMTRLVGHVVKSDGWKAIGATLDGDIRKLYARRAGILRSGFWTYASWMAGAMEVWIALYAIDRGQASFSNAVIMESVAQGARAALFFVPGALGVQEGAYLGIAVVLGVPGEIALALALIRRVRELSFGVPGLIGWQVLENRWAWKRRREGVSGGDAATQRTTTTETTKC